MAGEWPLVPLGTVVAEARTGFASGERAADGVVQLRMNNVTTDGRIVWDKFLRVPADPATIENYRLRTGDVLFNNTNSTELVGKSALFTQHVEPVVYSNHFTRIRVDSERFVPGFLVHWLHHQWRCGTFSRICNKWIGQSAVKPNKLLAMLVPLPPLSIQQQVAERLFAALDMVSTARRTALEELALLDALPAALLRDAFGEQPPPAVGE